jgi:hypothetical protein
VSDFVKRRAAAVERDTGQQIRSLLAAHERPSDDLMAQHLDAWRTRTGRSDKEPT